MAATRKSGGESERTACLGIRKEKKRFTFLCCRVLLINLTPRLEPPDQGFSWEPGFPGWPIKNKIRSLKKEEEKTGFPGSNSNQPAFPGAATSSQPFPPPLPDLPERKPTNSGRGANKGYIKGKLKDILRDILRDISREN